MKRWLTILPVLIVSILPAYAQFNKYKAKTEFQKSQGRTNSVPPAPSAPAPGAALPDSQDFFGRGTGVRGVKKTAEQQKYVNLNPETAFGPEVVTSFNFPDTSLLDLTRHMQKLTGINLMWDKDIKGKVTILAPSPITVGDAWKAYLTALNVNGYSLVKSGAFYKIINAREARTTPTKIYSGAFTPNVENYLMKIIPIKHIKTSEIKRKFRTFLSKYGRIEEIEQTNTIIIIDTGANINRLVKLIRFIDVPGHEESLHIIAMKHSSAQEIAKLLDSILKTGKGKDAGRFRAKTAQPKDNSNISKIIAEPRTNSIIALANDQGIEQLRALIAKLDVKFGAQSADKIHVYYLNYGNAKDLAQTLSALVNNAHRPGTRNPRSSITRRLSAQRGSDAQGLFSADIKITADESNNALVVTASPTDWLTIEQVIQKLDIPRDQVYVEGMIMETSVSQGRDTGISIVGAYGRGAGQRVGILPNSGIIDLLTNNLTNLGGLFVGVGGGKNVTLNIGGQSITVDTVTGLIRAIATDSNTNVLATPQILALDNEEAEFEVGESIPILETTTVNGVMTSSQKTQDVTLKIKIKPQINKVTRFIKLKIDQDIRDFSPREVKGTGQGVVTTTRRAVTTVVVRDRDTIAMGGLMRDQISDTENKVPLLGDIPVLGWLFKSKESVVRKINLLFFLTPQILSPYESTSGPLLKDTLNRRSAHLKEIHGEDDPFHTTAKGLFEKAGRQIKGPIYDQLKGSKFYRQQNRKQGIGGAKQGTEKQATTPDYGEIERSAQGEGTEDPGGG